MPDFIRREEKTGDIIIADHVMDENGLLESITAMRNDLLNLQQPLNDQR